LFGNVIHRDLFTGFNNANGYVVTVAAAGVGIAGVVDETVDEELPNATSFVRPGFDEPWR